MIDLVLAGRSMRRCARGYNVASHMGHISEMLIIEAEVTIGLGYPTLSKCIA